MDEEMFECYTEWANDEFIWGRGMGNWFRSYNYDRDKNTPSPYADDEVPDIPF